MRPGGTRHPLASAVHFPSIACRVGRNGCRPETLAVDPLGHRRQQLRTHGASAGVPRRSALRGGGAGRQRRARAPRSGPREAGIPHAFGDWRELVEDARLDAVAIATPPSLQPEIAIRRARSSASRCSRKSRWPPICAGARAAANRRGQQAGRLMIDFDFHRTAGLAAGQGAARRRRDRRAAPCRRALACGELRDPHAAEELEDRAATTAAACSAISSAIASIISNGSAGRSPDLSARLSGLPGRCRASKAPWRSAVRVRSPARGSACR